MPEIRPFRALRFDPAVVGDVEAVVAPPYDVIDTATERRLLGRHPANVVRVELPAVEPGDAPDDRYRRAARTMAAWRSDGTLHKDAHPSIYVCEQRYRVPGPAIERTQWGAFVRLRLEAFGPSAGVLPHERTLAAPREDRYKLLRATGINTSPVVGLVEDPSSAALTGLRALTAGRPADLEATDEDGTIHRLWAIPADGDQAEAVASLTAALGAGPVTIADGHHRYETALRYRDERRMSRSCEEDPPFDYVLTFVLPTGSQPLTVLPTHRIATAAVVADAPELLARAGDLFDVERGVSAEALRGAFEAGGPVEGGHGRFGLWTAAGGARLTARRDAFERWLPAGGPAFRGLDVTLLGVALERLLGIDAAAVSAGAVDYTKSAAEAIARVDADPNHATAAFLLEATPVSAIEAVAREGDVMPQKSTYFFPKALTGLVLNPHEW